VVEAGAGGRVGAAVPSGIVTFLFTDVEGSTPSKPRRWGACSVAEPVALWPVSVSHKGKNHHIVVGEALDFGLTMETTPGRRPDPAHQHRYPPRRPHSRSRGCRQREELGVRNRMGRVRPFGVLQRVRLGRLDLPVRGWR
jgi:hypothetical protein